MTKSLPTICEEYANRWAQMPTFIKDKSGRARKLAIRKFTKQIKADFGFDEDLVQQALHDTLTLMRLIIIAEED